MKCVTPSSGFALLFLFLAGVAAIGQADKKPDEPLATFTGTVRSIDGKTLIIEVPEGNTLELNCTRKTRYYDGSKKIKFSAINPGDRVTVEARPDLLLKPEAVIVHLEHPKTAAPEKPAN